MAGTPSFVFSYLPSSAKTTVTNSATSISEQTSSFFDYARKAFNTPRLTADQDQLLTLQKTKQHLEEHATLKARAGMSISSSEKAQLRTVDQALAAFSK